MNDLGMYAVQLTYSTNFVAVRRRHEEQAAALEDVETVHSACDSKLTPDLATACDIRSGTQRKPTCTRASKYRFEKAQAKEQRSAELGAETSHGTSPLGGRPGYEVCTAKESQVVGQTQNPRVEFDAEAR